MAGIFEDIQFQKTDLNTVKELKEDCWRKAQGEDLEAFLGFYLKKKPARSWQIAAWAALFVFLISAGELGFERLCKNDPSYNPVPMTLQGDCCICFLHVCARFKAAESCYG